MEKQLDIAHIALPCHFALLNCLSQVARVVGSIVLAPLPPESN